MHYEHWTLNRLRTDKQTKRFDEFSTSTLRRGKNKLSFGKKN